MVNDSTVAVFDDERAVANAGVMLPAVLAARLGVEALVDECVDLGDRAGAANPGRKVMTLASAMTLGADCIEDCDVLRSGQTTAVLDHRVVAREQRLQLLAGELDRIWPDAAGSLQEGLTTR